MIKALRYLKPFWLSVIAIIVLTFAQVQFELALPDYMSGIVTYGIQYSGISDPVPQALRASTAEHMFLFMSEEEQEQFQKSYTLYPSGSTEMADLYPAMKSEDVYVLSSPDSSADFSSSFLIVSMLESEPAAEMSGMDSQALYTMLETNPEMKETILSKVSEQLSSYTEENQKSASLLALKNEYAALGMNIESLQNQYILKEGLMMLLITFLGSLCAVGSSFLSSRTATGACRNMRADVFRRVESFSSEEFSRFSTASLITRTTNDIQQIQQVINMSLRVVLFAPFMGLTSLFKVMRYKGMANILGWVLLVIVILMTITFVMTLPKFRLIQKLVDRLNLVTREQLSGMLVIRAFNNQEVEEKRFDDVNREITSVNIFVNRMLATIMPAMTFLMSFISVLIIWSASRQIDLGTMQIGDMMAFLQYAIHVLMSFMIVAVIFIMIPRSSVSATRIFEVLETEPMIHDPNDPKTLPQENQPITFHDVSFRYPNAEESVLRHISFEANPGETVAFIGSTGSGKSTLVNLIPRFFDVTEGSITYGNTDIRDVRQSDLRDRIGYVPQKGILFSGTIESNLRYADEAASPEMILQALDVSQSKEFVDRMPKGIQEPVAQGGTNVSGGQKQRLSIARALVKDPQVYIFDDAFSALDYATDAKLREALNRLVEKTKATVLIVAQRISTIRHADKIIVLDNGEITGIGTHDALMKNCSVYQEIALSQLSEEELA
ncbi:MAG: ABC transporter ATP-binding protein [Solobacterium sp.]|nr:ABC transporter ATP-binding protein [Solobacterium sp.]